MSLWHLSLPLSARVNSSDLFTFTLVFQRTELETAEDWFVYQLMEFVYAGSCIAIALFLFLGFMKQCYYRTLPFDMLCSGGVFLNLATAESLSISLRLLHKKYCSAPLKTTMFCTVTFLLGHSTMYLCYVSSYFWVLVCDLDCSNFLFVFSTNRMHPESHKELVGFKNIPYRIYCCSVLFNRTSSSFLFQPGDTLFSSTQCSPLIIFRFSSSSPSISLLLVPFHWADVLFCSPGGNVFLITACVSSYLQFFYQWPPHMPERRGWGGSGAADAISRWRFHHRVQGPSVARGGPDRKGLTWERAI